MAEIKNEIMPVNYRCKYNSPGFYSWVGTTRGIPIRSLNRRTDDLERRLYLFRANKLESLAFGTPHWGDASLVCRSTARACIPHAAGAKLCRRLRLASR